MSEQTKNVRSLLGPQPERKGFPRRGEEGPLLYWGAAPTPAASACYQHIPPLTASASACRRLSPAAPPGGNPFPALPPRPFHPPPASKTFRGYSRLRREITSSQPTSQHHSQQRKNEQAHKMTVLRISSYHAPQNPLFSGKQPHNMSFYRYFVIICEGNERAGQIGPASDGQPQVFPQSVHPGPVSDGQVSFFRPCVHPEGCSGERMHIYRLSVHGGTVSDGQVFATGVFSYCLGIAGAEGFSSAGRGGPSPEPPAAPPGGNPFPAHLSRPFHPPPASNTFRGYSRLRREITSFPIHYSAPFPGKGKCPSA